MKHCFKNHEAKLTDFGDIKIIDWRNKNGSSEFYIRYLFDETLCALYITGDCGSFVVRNYDNVCYEKIKDFFEDLDYFASKIKASTYGTITFDYDQAMKDAKEYLQMDGDIDPKVLDNAMHELDEMIFLEDHGFVTNGKELRFLPMIDPQYYEWLSNCGRKIDSQVELVLDGLKEAWTQLHNGKENG